MPLLIREIAADDRPWIRQFLIERWASPLMVTRGRIHDTDRLPGYIAEIDGEKVGLLTYRKENGACEVVTIDSIRSRHGVGTALLDAVRANAALHGCRRLWLVTTNDNLPALAFYKSSGFTVAAIHEGAMDEARRLKPEIPEIGIDGVPIRDEIELEITRASRPSETAEEPATQSG